VLRKRSCSISKGILILHRLIVTEFPRRYILDETEGGLIYVPEGGLIYVPEGGLIYVPEGGLIYVPSTSQKTRSDR